ncbi:MAG: hypothetical protein JNJ46_16280 [Myxococcales bacterium]|nr:hypothetical protein [Myxococcales bacterium]
MRSLFAAAVLSCTWGFLTWGSAPAQAAELTDMASSFEKDKVFGFRFGASYQFSYKTARIMRESVPYLQNPTTKRYLEQRFLGPRGNSLELTETVPDLTYTQRRHAMSIDLAIGLFQELQLGVSLPLVLRDERQYNFDREAGYNTCAATDAACIAEASSTVLDGIYPVQPADQAMAPDGSLLFRAPVRGGSGKDMLDTINLSLMGAPVSQRRDPTKPTWVIGLDAQISIGTIMGYDTTRLRLKTDANTPAEQALIDASTALDPTGKAGWGGVSDGLNRFVIKTALSHRFRYVDPYLGLWYMIPLARTWDNANSPWKQDLGFAQKRGAPQQKAGATFGFEATPLENKKKGHRLALDFRAGLTFTFLGKGYSEAWELFSASNALICDDQTALPPQFNFEDPNGPQDPMSMRKLNTQGYFNPACRTPDDLPNAAVPRLPTTEKRATGYFQKPYNGLTVIENYLTFNADVGIVVELFRHARLRLSGYYQRDQGHGITQDDAGTIGYPSDAGDRVTVNGGVNGGRGCDQFRVDLKCPYDWNPAYRAVINQPGRRYRVEDINVYGGSAMLQAFW